jgi:hypothetical protein
MGLGSSWLKSTETGSGVFSVATHVTICSGLRNILQVEYQNGDDAIKIDKDGQTIDTDIDFDDLVLKVNPFQWESARDDKFYTTYFVLGGMGKVKFAETGNTENSYIFGVEYRRITNYFSYGLSLRTYLIASKQPILTDLSSLSSTFHVTYLLLQFNLTVGYGQ